MNTETIETTTEAEFNRPLTDILADLRQARTNLIVANTVLTAATGARDVYAREEAGIKDELREAMEEAGIKTGEGSGLQAQLKTRKSNVVLDPTILSISLVELGIIEDFLILDKASAAKYAVANGLPGVGIQETTSLAIVEVK